MSATRQPLPVITTMKLLKECAWLSPVAHAVLPLSAATLQYAAKLVPHKTLMVKTTLHSWGLHQWITPK